MLSGLNRAVVPALRARSTRRIRAARRKGGVRYIERGDCGAFKARGAMESLRHTRGGLHVLLPTLGSAGDVFPLMDLGIALQQRGHRATHRHQRILCRPDSRFRPRFHRPGHQAGGRGGALPISGSGIPPRASSASWSEWSRPTFRASTRSFASAARRTRWSAHRPFASARASRRSIWGSRWPASSFSRRCSRSLIDAGMQGRVPMGPGAPRWAKKAFFKLADTLIVDRVLGPPLNAFRAKLGLPAVRRILAEYIHSPQLVLGFFPEWFARPQPDWPAKTHLTGFVLHEAGEQATVSAEVEEFLAGGPAPVLFTPGTGAAQQTKFFRESVEACRLAGLRGMLVTSHSQQIPRDLPPDVRAFSYVPFGKVLRRCSALVYHGGVGTLAQGIKAGIPHLVVPNSHDQPDNARRVEQLGLGCRVYPERYKAARVAQILGTLTNGAALRQRCQKYSARVDSHAALAKACELLEGLG